MEAKFTTDVAKTYNALLEANEHLLQLHRGAERVMASARKSGWGSFRVDGLSDGMAELLPAYIRAYEGERLPNVLEDVETGKLTEIGGTLVKPEHSKFSVTEVLVDADTGVTQTYFAWDKELWDPEAAEEAAKKEAKADRRDRVVKYTASGIMALAFATATIGLGIFVKGSHDASDARRDGASQTEIDEIIQSGDKGLYLTMGAAAAATTIVMVGALGDMRRVTQEADNDPLARYPKVRITYPPKPKA